MNSRNYNRRKPSNRISRSKSPFESECDIPKKECETSSNYNKADIMMLADNCGVDVYDESGEEKTRKQLCKDIRSPVISSSLPAPIEQLLQPVIQPRIYTIGELKRLKKKDLIEIAEDVGVIKINGKLAKYAKNDDLIEAILDMNPAPITDTSLRPISLEDLELEPVSVPAPIPISILPEPVISRIENVIDSKVLMGNTKNRLLEMAAEYGITKWKGKSIKSYNKPDIVEAIVDYLESQSRAVRETEIVIPPPEVILPPVTVSPPVVSFPVVKLEPTPSPVSEKPPSIAEQLSKKRQELIKLLKLRESQKCDPILGVDCNVGDVCDINKQPNVCISQEEAAYREIKGKDEVFEFAGRQLIGNKKSINSFKRLLDTFPSGGVEESKEYIPEITVAQVVSGPSTKKTFCDICSYTNDPDTTYCIICNSELTNDEIKTIFPAEGTEIVETVDMIPEGTEIADIRNIEDILRDIQNTEETSIEGMDEAKRKVLYCLGLLS